MAFGGRSQLKMSEETFDFVCTSCAKKDKTVEAVKYCVECSEYFCQPCIDAHNMFSALENHNLMEVSQGNVTSGQSASLPEFPTERCSKHKGKVMDMYCEGHDVVGCSTCFVKDHKLCQDSHIHSIPDMIDSIFKLSDCKQTHSLLKDMLVAMETVSKSKDTQLETLNKAKKEALDKVTTFQKALEAIVRKAAESSRQEVEAAYKELENDILKKRQMTEDVREDLQTTDEKLNQSEGNRAQRFVCTKIAQLMMKEADSEKIKQDLQHNSDVQISFIPDQSLLKYIKALEGIGQVQKHKKQIHPDLYKIKGSRDINITLSGDSRKCNPQGCCLIHDNQLLVTDASNNKLKRIDIQNMSVIDQCTLDYIPYGVCCISQDEVAVACFSGKKIQFVSVQGKMTPTRQIKMSHRCYGIAFKDGNLYVTDQVTSLYVYDMIGTLLKTITQSNTGNNLFNNSRHVTFNENGNRMFVVGGNNVVVCFDWMGNYLSTITGTELGNTAGVCVDGRGNMFVVGYDSDNVVQFSENGKKVGMVVKQQDGLHKPVSVYFHQGLDIMFVTMFNSNVVKMYELE